MSTVEISDAVAEKLPATTASMTNNEFLQTLIDSKKLPPHIKTVSDAFTIAQMGKELGFPIMQAFHFIIPIDGKLTLSAKAINAILRTRGVKIKTLEDSLYVWADGVTSKYNIRTDTEDKPIDRRTTILFTRGDELEECEFTWKDALQQDLVKKANWVKMPKEMLYARCLSRGANRVAADFLLGLYGADEIVDSCHISESRVTRDDDGFTASIDVTPAKEAAKEATAA